MIAAADADSETARSSREVGCGIVVPPGRPELLARAIRAATTASYDLEEMGAPRRAYAEREADRAVAVERYRDAARGACRAA